MMVATFPAGRLKKRPERYKVASKRPYRKLPLPPFIPFVPGERMRVFMRGAKLSTSKRMWHGTIMPGYTGPTRIYLAMRASCGQKMFPMNFTPASPLAAVIIDTKS
uniref:Uncharacterized protein n=1 Tax=Candidatus Kentrum sp. SD TaxID=2126332 RepID=A0A450YLZ7_9GAMM|nr:MAG: hypothetical protein BECKSD772F_GA0070984_101916 [Candidatus Kentron sp. SD]VFK42574.1 MAG: hypothetical protein BECKSD772E_GA0070983_101817 [Candidatus Kentron sp. SD]VFK77861.1 MAG: hypothetical protein BECKSD772D_GA0070982_100317 [Candidatus Kentron sp. SD]